MAGWVEAWDAGVEAGGGLPRGDGGALPPFEGGRRIQGRVPRGRFSSCTRLQPKSVRIQASRRLGAQKPNAKAQSRQGAAAATPSRRPTGADLNAESAPLAGAQSEEAHFVAP